jgi:hypothetical protein
MSSGFLKALGVLAKSPSLNRYLNVLKPAEEGVSRGMDYFNNAVKKVVDEGDQIDKTLDTVKYVHPDRPDIFVEIDVNTGKVNVGLLDEEAGAFAYSDLELEPRSADIKEKAKLMKEMGKTKMRGKRSKMIDAANRILRGKKADGGRVGYAKGKIVKEGLGALKLFKRPQYYSEDAAKMTLDLIKTGRYTEKQLLELADDQIAEIYAYEGFKVPEPIEPSSLIIDMEEIMENIKNVTPEDMANGGRVGMFMGGSLPKGAGLLRQLIKMAAKEKGLEKPSEMLSRFNPKKVDRLLDDPNIFLKADVKEGIMATDKIKDFKNTAQSARVDIVSYLLSMAKDLRKSNLTIQQQNKIMMDEAVKMGVDKETAETFVKGLTESMRQSVGLSDDLIKPTEQGVLELETILKNLKTGGKPSRSLNADGGYIGLKDGGQVSLTVIEIPDISGSGVETLFKKR